VIDPVAELVDRVISRCPAIRLLATSREPLLVPGEYVRRLAPLSTEDGAAAERLFRARAHAAGVAVDEGDPSVAEICRSVDGLPLALELAAARVGDMTTAELATAIRQSQGRLFRRGGAQRQRTLDALVGWSYDRLTVSEQRSMLALSVLPAGFRPDTASGFLARVNGAASDAVERLVRRSLLDVDGDRLRMLAPIRNVIRDLLVAEPEFESHVGHALAEWALAVIEERDLVRVIDDAFDDDLYLALEEAFARNHASGFTGRGLLLRVLYWRAGGDRLTVRLASMCEELVTHPVTIANGDDAVLMSAALRGTLGWAVAGAAGVRWPAERVLELAAAARSLGDPDQARYCLSVLGGYCVSNGDVAAGRDLLVEALDVIEAHAELAEWRLAVIGTLGIAHHLAGDLDQAESCYREQMQRGEAAGDPGEVATGASNLAELLLDNGDATAAAELLKPIVQNHHLGESLYVIGLTLMAEALYRSGRADEGSVLAPEARRRLEVIVAVDPGMKMYLERLESAIANA
jgi:tetratricopeptide (TPR) repeat protein